jgi:hypothetical protein
MRIEVGSERTFPDMFVNGSRKVVSDPTTRRSSPRRSPAADR